MCRGNDVKSAVTATHEMGESKMQLRWYVFWLHRKSSCLQARTTDGRIMRRQSVNQNMWTNTLLDNKGRL